MYLTFANSRYFRRTHNTQLTGKFTLLGIWIVRGGSVPRINQWGIRFPDAHRKPLGPWLSTCLSARYPSRRSFGEELKSNEGIAKTNGNSTQSKATQSMKKLLFVGNKRGEDGAAAKREVANDFFLRASTAAPFSSPEAHGSLKVRKPGGLFLLPLQTPTTFSICNTITAIVNFLQLGTWRLLTSHPSQRNFATFQG
jgi:hypothetical protein